MIKPSIGRVVWFTPSATEHHDPEQPWAALITYVHSDRLVNLAAFDPNGSGRGQTSVTLLQDDDVIPAGGYFCSWMPFQIGQAKAAESK